MDHQILGRRVLLPDSVSISAQRTLSDLRTKTEGWMNVMSYTIRRCHSNARSSLQPWYTQE